MGFIRGSIMFFLVILLLISLVLGNIFLTLNYSLSHDVVKPEIVSLTDSIGGASGYIEQLQSKFPSMESYCNENKTSYVIKTNISTLEIPCETILNGTESTTDYIKGQVADGIYYKKYNCGVLECFNNNEYLFFLSEEAKNYWQGKFYLFLAISLAIIGLMFLVIEEKTELFLVTGTVITLSSLPFMKINSLLSFLDSSSLQLIPIIFSKSHKVFLIMASIGIFLLIIGILAKFFNFGNFIMEKFSKNKKQKEIIKPKTNIVPKVKSNQQKKK